MKHINYNYLQWIVSLPCSYTQVSDHVYISLSHFMLFHRAENLILASDPDREGEAIAWHIIEMLQQQGALHDNLFLARVVFHEITEQAIKTALQAPREIDVNLVHAYLARRALDYLIGFNISPLLWKKLPGCKSAGRVQSAALSLVCDREMEIDQFKPKEYWTMEAKFNMKERRLNKDLTFLAHLTHFDSKKLNQFSITSGGEARDIESKINSTEFRVISMKRDKFSRSPPTPYRTSTLQQDAANKLNFSASQTMMVLILVSSYHISLLDITMAVMNNICFSCGIIIFLIIMFTF